MRRLRIIAVAWWLYELGIAIFLCAVKSAANIMIDQTDSHDKNKWANRLILLGIFLIFIAFRIAWEGDVFRKPDITHYRPFDDVFQNLSSTIRSYIYDGKSGVCESIDMASIINEEEFISGLLEAIYKKTKYVKNIKGYFDAGVFKILVRDNFLYIKTDLDKAAHYMSRSPLKMRDSLAGYAAYHSRRLFEQEGFFDGIRSKYGYRGGRSFLGNFDIDSPVAFSEEMNELYMMIFSFSNDPPISIGVFP